MSDKPKPKPKEVLGGCLVLIVLAFAILAIGSFVTHHALSAKPPVASTSDNTANPSPPVVIDVTASAYYRAYHKNEVAADSVYRGKALQIRGTLASINKDFTDDVYLELQTPNEFEGIHADLKKQETSLAGKLEKGDPITLDCVGGEMVVGIPTLTDCTIFSYIPH